MKKSIFTSGVIILLVFIIPSNSFGDDKGIGISNSGLGDVLLAPLYDVRTLTDPNLPGAAGTALQTQSTLISIVNTDDNYGVIARLKFKEWKRSVDCLYFDIPLSTHDVWVGELSRNPSGGFYLMSPDRYVSNIANPYPDTTAFTTTTFTAPGLPSLTYAFETNAANAQQRCEYGYIEVIGEERVGAPTAARAFPRLAVPAVPDTATDRDVGNVLMGNVYIIRPDQEIAHQYNMTAIQNFAVDARGIYRPPSTVFPTLAHDVQGEFPNGLVPQNPGAGGLNQLEALLSKRYINFQYVNPGVTGGNDPTDPSSTPMSTSVVVTFPTKWVHYRRANPIGKILPVTTWPGPTPFTGAFETLGDGNPYGEVVNFRIWDRNENSLVMPIIPLPPSIPRLPYEVNIIGLIPKEGVAPYFRNNYHIATASASTGQTFYSGWGSLDLSPAVGFISDTRTVQQGENVATSAWSYWPVFSFFNTLFNQYNGLPAIGVVMKEFFNDPLRTYYGGTVPWQYSTDWRTSGSSARCDFNGDGKTDILWRNKSTGQNVVWLMNGTAFSSYVWIETVADTNWEIVGTGDFNGDGKTDILWRNKSTGQNVVWLMNGTTYSNYTELLQVPDTNRQIVGTGDFNGDGSTDILWRNKSTGQNIIWLMDGTTYSNYTEIQQVPDTNRQIVGTGDFNGDGKTDILWRNKSTGQNVVWLMNGTTYSNYTELLQVPDTNWEIVGTGDFNGDGKTDILWRNKSTGQNIVWLMDGTTYSNYAELLQVTDTNWEIVGPK